MILNNIIEGRRNMNLLECCVCLLQYDCETRKPCIGTCGHSICQQCRRSLDNFNCPECRRGKSFSEETINIEITRILQNSDVVEVIAKKRRYEFYCHNCEEGIEDPQVCIDCCLAAGILSRKTENEGDEGLVWNTKEKSPYICIEKAESQSMCINCASENHWYHKLISFKILKENVFQKTMKDFIIKFIYFNCSCRNYQNEVKKTVDNSYKLIEQLFQAKKNLPQEQVYAHIENVEKFMKLFMETMTGGLNQLKDLNNEIEEQISFINENKTVPNYGDKINVAVDSRVYSINLFNKKASLLDSLSRNYSGSIQIGNKVYYTEHISDENGMSSTAINIYNIETGERKYIDSIPDILNGPMTLFGDKLILLESSQKVKTFDLSTKTCTDLGKFFKERAQCICLSYKDDLYVIGGIVYFHTNQNDYGYKYANSIEKFNESMGKFELLYYSDNIKYFSTGIVFNDKIYLAGATKESEKVKSFDPINYELNDEPAFVKPKANVRFYVLDEVLYAIEINNNSVLSVEKLDLRRNRWKLIM